MKKMKKYLFILPVLLLVIAGIIYYTNYRVDSLLFIEVNPSFELKLNSQDKVIDIIGKNDDAKTFLKDFKISKKDVDLVMESITIKLLEKGFLIDESSNMIITVSSKKASKAEILQNRLQERIQERLTEKNSKAKIYSQGISSEDMESLKETAENNDISLGRTLFIKRIINKDSSLSFEELVDKDQKELVELVKEKKVQKNSTIEENEELPISTSGKKFKVSEMNPLNKE